ncbi:MAG: Crp/Fnr family transcriptional regulator [Longimicrobiales bacterium]
MPLKVIPRRDRKLHRLVKKGETLTLKRGQALFHPGDPARDLFLVRKGHLRLWHPGREARPQRIVAIVGPWELGGERGLFPGAFRDSGATAGEDSVVTVLDGAGARRALQTSEKTFEAFLMAKESELALAEALKGYRKPGGARARLGLLLLNLADRIGRPGDGGIRIPIRLTHQLLADLAASHRSTVTTILNDWIYREVIQEKEGHLEIPEPGGLGESTGRGASPSSVDPKTL